MKRSIGKISHAHVISLCAKKVTACILSATMVILCCPFAFAAEEIDSTPLTPQELGRMTEAEIVAISQEQSDATLNKMVQLYNDGKKSELDQYFSALGIATTYEEYEKMQLQKQQLLSPGIQPLWQSDTGVIEEPQKRCHETLTAYGFLMYIGAMQELFPTSDSSGYTIADLTSLSDCVSWPDWDLEQSDNKLYLGHFYDPDTGENYAHQTNNTAKTRAEKYYNLAISSYLEGGTGNRVDAIAYLGYCLHYVQDVAVPHHAANKTGTPLDKYNHSGFETLASKILIEEEAAADLDVDYELSFYNKCLSTEVGDIVHEIATSSKAFIDVASDKNNEAGQRLLLAFLLPNTMYETSGILFKFAKEVGMI